jgi:hypothetical protein
MINSCSFSPFLSLKGLSVKIQSLLLLLCVCFGFSQSFAQDTDQKKLESELKNAPAPSDGDADEDADVVVDSKSKKKPKHVKKKKPTDWPRKRPASIKKAPELGTIPFAVGEHLVFKINLLNAHAGTVTLRVGAIGTYQGQRVVEFAGFIQSSPFTDNFYPIKDSLVVLVDEKTFLPIKSDFHLEEKNTKIDFQSKFNQKTGVVHWQKKTYKNGLRERNEEFAGASPLYESLSSLYAIRRLKITQGLAFEQYVWDGRRERLVDVKVIGDEKVLTDLGWIEATKVQISSKITGGFVPNSALNQGPISGTAWFAKDEAQTPVKLISPTKLGVAEVILTKKYVEAPKK